MRNVQRIINRNRIAKEPRKKLLYKPLLKRPFVTVLKIKMNGTVLGLLVASQKKNQFNITYVDFIWVNQKHTIGITTETESTYYQALYDLFMQWHENFILGSCANYKAKVARENHKIAISLNITKNEQIDRLRRILTLYGFSIDSELSLQDAEFKTPYRDKEEVKVLIYSRRF